MKLSNTLTLIAFILFTYGCSNNDQTNSVADEIVNEVESGERSVTLSEASVELTFNEAELTLASHKKLDSTYSFNYSVKQYELKDKTSDADHRHCANSGKGQHIHFILNNAPYKAKYDASFEETLNPGTNVILSFLSRSYHESIKNGKAYELTVLENSDVKTIDFDPNASHLFYSRPKGTYKGDDGKKILVDFYLINNKLSENGNKVILTVDGEEFTITKWAPYFIEGLESGEHKFNIKLVDSSNKLIEGPFNDSGERTIIVEQ